MNLNFIVPDINMTFGELKFLGLNRERYAYVDGKRTDTLESRVYNLGSSVQGG
ncbi:YdcP family protein, partial [Bacillus spizizenii]|nr:YdcP family protein [Bacillus spizizenii]